MKNLPVIAALLLVTSCGGVRRAETSSDDDRDTVDTIWLGEGKRYIHKLAYAPMNEAAWWCDSNDVPLIVCSKASETDAQVLMFYYNEAGRIEHVREYVTDLDLYNIHPDTLFACLYHGEGECDSPPSISREYDFVYSHDGHLVEINSSDRADTLRYNQLQTIKAAPGSHIEGDFRPCVRFWISDLHGGMMNMYCREVPDDADRDTYSLRRWINFFPVTEALIENGQMKKARVYYSIYVGDYADLEGNLDLDDDINTLRESEAWEDEFGQPDDFDRAPVMPEEFGNFPKTIIFH